MGIPKMGGELVNQAKRIPCYFRVISLSDCASPVFMRVSEPYSLTLLTRAHS